MALGSVNASEIRSRRKCVTLKMENPISVNSLNFISLSKSSTNLVIGSMLVDSMSERGSLPGIPNKDYSKK